MVYKVFDEEILSKVDNSMYMQEYLCNLALSRAWSGMQMVQCNADACIRSGADHQLLAVWFCMLCICQTIESRIIV